jgi:hypothetical protein
MSRPKFAPFGRPLPRATSWVRRTDIRSQFGLLRSDVQHKFAAKFHREFTASYRNPRVVPPSRRGDVQCGSGIVSNFKIGRGRHAAGSAHCNHRAMGVAPTEFEKGLAAITDARHAIRVPERNRTANDIGDFPGRFELAWL